MKENWRGQVCRCGYDFSMEEISFCSLDSTSFFAWERAVDFSPRFAIQWESYKMASLPFFDKMWGKGSRSLPVFILVKNYRQLWLLAAVSLIWFWFLILIAVSLEALNLRRAFWNIRTRKILTATQKGVLSTISCWDVSNGKRRHVLRWQLSTSCGKPWPRTNQTNLVHPQPWRSSGGARTHACGLQTNHSLWPRKKIA